MFDSTQAVAEADSQADVPDGTYLQPGLYSAVLQKKSDSNKTTDPGPSAVCLSGDLKTT